MSERSASRRTSIPAIVRKVIVTAITGGLAYLVTNAVQESQLWSITLSAFIGSVVLVIQFLSDFENRLSSVEEGQNRRAVTIEKLVSDGFSKINEATKLFGLLEASALRTDVVIQLVQHSIQLGPNSPPMIYDFLDRPKLLTDPEVVSVCRLRKQMGIDVRVLHPAAVPVRRRSSLIDFIVFDNVLSYELVPASRIGRDKGTVIAQTRLVLRPNRVPERAQGSMDLWTSADNFEENDIGQRGGTSRDESKARPESGSGEDSGHHRRWWRRLPPHRPR